MGVGRGLVGGAVGGTVGAALMLPLFAAATRLGLLPQPPPARVVDWAAAAAAGAAADPAAAPPPGRGPVVVGSHLLYGAVAGAGYGVGRRALGLPGAVAGPAFGLAVWAASYAGWLPATGILPRPGRQPAGAAWTPVAAHLVYGLALGLVEPRVGRR